MFSLRWNQHQTNMLSVFDKLLQSEVIFNKILMTEILGMRNQILLIKISHLTQLQYKNLSSGIL